MLKLFGKKISTPIGIAIILVCAVAVFGGVVGYKFLWREREKGGTSPTEPLRTSIKDETTNWKTYENSAMKFSIKYPFGWEVGEEKSRGDSASIYIDKINQGLYSGINIMRGPLNPPDKTEEWNSEEILSSYEKEVIDEEFPNAKKEERKEIIIDGINGAKFCGVTQEEEQYCDVVIILDRYGPFVIRCLSEEQECGPTFSQMLYTFKFID